MNEKDVIKIVLDELKRRGFIRNDTLSVKNTKSLLYSYNNLKKSIDLRKEQIRDLENEGIPGRSKSILLNVGHSNNSNDDPVEIAIKNIQNQIAVTKVTIDYIDKVLLTFKNDPYYDIIRLKYFENKTIEEIAAFYDSKLKKTDKLTANSTISKNDARLINAIRVLLIPNIYVNDLMY